MHRLHLHGLVATTLAVAAGALLIPSTQSLPEVEGEGTTLAAFLASNRQFSVSPVCSDCSVPGQTFEEFNGPSWLDVQFSVGGYMSSRVNIDGAPLARLEDLQDRREPTWLGFPVIQRTKDDIFHRTMGGMVSVVDITPFQEEGDVIQCRVQIRTLDNENVNVEPILLTMASTSQGLVIHDTRTLDEHTKNSHPEPPYEKIDNEVEGSEHADLDTPYVPIPTAEIDHYVHRLHQDEEETDGHLRAHDHVISLNCPEDSSIYAAVCRMRATIIRKFGGLVQPPSAHKHGCHKNIKEVIHGGPDKFRRPVEQFADEAIQMTDDERSKLYGSHGGARPHHTKHHRVHHIGDDFEHRIHGYTQSIVQVLRRVVVGIIVPILVGIAAGMTASLLGMVVGTFIASVWVLVVRRGRRGNASERQRTMEAQVGLNDTDGILEPGEADGLLVVEKEDVVVPVAVTRAAEHASELDGSEAPPAYVEKE